MVTFLIIWRMGAAFDRILMALFAKSMLWIFPPPEYSAGGIEVPIPLYFLWYGKSFTTTRKMYHALVHTK